MPKPHQPQPDQAPKDKSELHLFIIWQNARAHEAEIVKDIAANFRILKQIEITWTKQHFSKNLTRFYNATLPPLNFKERECGNGPFLLLLVEDPAPKYEYRPTSRGRQLVNTHIFDKKSEYRKLVDSRPNSKVHATNSTLESDHDLTLLLGLSIYDVRDKLNLLPEHYHQDLLGTTGWDSLDQLFYCLNHTVNYLVLRNFDGLPDHFDPKLHGDIDLLTDDYQNLRRVLNGKKIHLPSYRVHYSAKVGKRTIYFDLRSVGDNYYDKRWQENLLATRELNSSKIYVPSAENHKYSLTYHALVHKSKIAPDYQQKLATFFPNTDPEKALTDFLRRHNYRYVEPRDLSVLFHPDKYGLPASPRRTLRQSYVSVRSHLKQLLKGNR